MTDWLSVLEREKPDVAVVNPPFYLLGTVIKACLARGIHVFGEKPLAIDRQDLLGVTHMAGRPAGPKLMAMLSMRYEPAFIAGQRYVAVGSLGLPLLITAQKSYPLLGWNGKPRDAFYHRRETYGGTIPWIGIHVIDQFRWFSESQFTEVRAMHTTLGNQGHGEMEIAATLEFKLASGALASANLDFLRLAKNGTWGDDRLRVAGDRGLLEIQAGRARVTTEFGECQDLELDPEPSMFTAFLDWISHGTPMRLSTADCLAASEAALLARDSADQGQVRLF
jgi:predicted dehydrogenase